MNKNEKIIRIAGIALAIGGILMAVIYFLKDWGLHISLPDMPFNFAILPIFLGMVMGRYSAEWNRGTKMLMWAAAALFIIATALMLPGYETGSWMSIACGALTVIAMLKTAY